MKVKLKSGKIVNLSYFQNRSPEGDIRCRSSYHLLAREVIKECFTDPLYEEVHVPGENFYLDFFIPSRKIVVEVHGEQHYEFNSFFHKTKLDFLKQKTSDKNKRSFCEYNGFSYVEFPYNESKEQWTKRLLDC